MALSHPEFSGDAGYLLCSIWAVHRRLAHTPSEDLTEDGEIGFMELCVSQCPQIIDAIDRTVNWSNWDGVFSYDVLDEHGPNSLPESVYVAIMQGADPVPVALQWLSTCPDFPWTMPLTA